MAVDPEARKLLDRLAELRALRAGFDTSWQKISELMLPSRSFQLTRAQGELRTRMVRDPIGILGVKRLAAFIYGYMLSQAEPWVAPRLVARDPSTEEASWFELAKLRMHERLSGPTSSIALHLFEGALDIVAFGTNVMFQATPLGQPPRLRSVALAQCFIGQNAEDEVDEVFRVFTLTARQAAERYRDPDIADMAGKAPQQSLAFLHATAPRLGGQFGAMRARKPWRSDVVWIDKARVLDESGFDRNPFIVGRFERRSGEVWGGGPGWDAYPAVWTCNAMAEAVIDQAELAVRPPLFGDQSLFGGRLDRRPGAFNPINANVLFGGRVSDAVGRLDMSGDVGMGVEMLERQRGQVERMFFIDWLSVREGPQMTATEVMDRRDLRLRMLAPVVARLEQEWLNPIVETQFFAMLKAGEFGRPPASLANEEIGFQYSSPLALAQRGQLVDAIRRTFALAAEAAAFDQTAPLVLRADELLRQGARLNGVSERRMRSFEELEQMRAERAEQQQAAENMAGATAAAGALQAGAQGAATLQQAGLLEAA
jgi:hypothetical protein